MKDVIIAIQFGLLIWFGMSIAKLENYHYANFMGICAEHMEKDYPLGEMQARVKREGCLHEAKVRTSPIWNFFEGLLHPED